MDGLFRVEMLGGLGVRQASREITRFRTQKTSILLAYLAYHRSRAHPRDLLIELFWPASELKAARTNLSVALNALRRQLEPPGVPPGAVLIADHAHVRLNPLTFTTDVEDFETNLRDAERETETDRRIAAWMAAVDLYRGDLLPGYYEDWISTERDRLRAAYMAALRQLVREHAETRQYERAIEYAHRAVQTDPLNEAVHRDLMRLYVAVGRAQDALHQYQKLEHRLQEELQSTPSAATRELVRGLPSITSMPGNTVEMPAARTREKDSCIAGGPPVPATRRPSARLPLPFTRYFGQEEAIARLVEALSGNQEAPISEPAMLTDRHARLLTLTGPGGTGKTRLSIEVARRVREAFAGGIWFVSLAELDDPLRLGEALRDVLDLPRQAHFAALDQAIAFLKGLEGASLLILDNFEQITAGGAPVVWTLLNRVPALCCLVTSRHALSLPGEREIPVLPLPTPTREPASHLHSALTTHLLTYPSVALFVDRAQAARPDFQITPRNAQAIAAVCEKLEGIPLAIELAAARTKALTPAQILDRLTPRFELLASHRAGKGARHRSLWTAIAWSYHLLPPGLQRFFARLSVFRGGWSLQAAEVVCEEPVALDYLSQLPGHSLIVAEESSSAIRFRMLETLREFAAEQLTPEEQAEIERRHASYFQQCVTGAQVARSEEPAWFDRLEEDLDNLRAVLAWSLGEGGDVVIGLRTANGLLEFWQERGYLSEGRRWHADLLERARDAPATDLGYSLYSAGSLAYFQGDFHAARPLLERSLEMFHALGDEASMARAHSELGSVVYRQGDYGRARLHFERSLALARALDKPLGVASALGNLANIAQSVGDFAVSRALNEESLEIRREALDRSGEARTLHNLANLAHSQGQLEEARVWYEQSLEIKRELADPYSVCSTLTGIAGLAGDQGDIAAAAAYARESLVLSRDLNARMNLADLLFVLTDLARAIGELETSARMAGALERVRNEMDYAVPPVERELYEKAQAAVREALGADAYDAARQEGAKLSLEQALACIEEVLASRSM